MAGSRCSLVPFAGHGLAAAPGHASEASADVRRYIDVGCTSAGAWPGLSDGAPAAAAAFAAAVASCIFFAAPVDAVAGNSAGFGGAAVVPGAARRGAPGQPGMAAEPSVRLPDLLLW